MGEGGGVPIGNYLSQYLANFYLTYFDHWLKEQKRIKYYFRYCDDLVILASNKEELHILLEEIQTYLKVNLKLDVKGNHQIFPVESRGIDFVGYVFYHKYIRLRKGIKKRFVGMVKYNDNPKSRASYNGWLSHADCINLTRKYLNYEKINRNQKIRIPEIV
jgi:RNA-directed DNA polymerase